MMFIVLICIMVCQNHVWGKSGKVYKLAFNHILLCIFMQTSLDSVMVRVFDLSSVNGTFDRVKPKTESCYLLLLCYACSIREKRAESSRLGIKITGGATSMNFHLGLVATIKSNSACWSTLKQPSSSLH